MESSEHASYGPSYVLQLFASLGIWYGLGRWGGLSNQSQQYEVILIWMFAFRPLSTLIHELGHAAAVRRLAHRSAEVVVGTGSPALKGRFGGLQVSFSPVPILGSQVAGICRYESGGVSWRTRGWISLAGPAATLLELLLMLALLPVWSHASVVVRDLIGVGTAMLALNVITNLLPTPLVRDPQGRVLLGRDGYNALHAFRNARRREPVPGGAALGGRVWGGAGVGAGVAGIAGIPGIGSLPEAEVAPGQMALTETAADARPVVDTPDTPRTLAQIWSSPQPIAEEPAAGPAERSGSGDLARGDFAQRALAEIWSTQPPETRQSSPATGAKAAAAGAGGWLRAPSEPAVADHVPEGVDGKLELAVSHLEAGRAGEAIPLLEAAIRALQAGGEEPIPGELVPARAALARAYLATRRPQLAIGLYESLLAEPSISDDQRVGYRVGLAQAFRGLGKASNAIDQLEALTAELEPGGDPERLIDAQVELATTYVVAHRIKDAVAAYEAALPHAERLLGTGHRKSLSVRLLLARAYQEQGQAHLATRTYRNLVSDAERALGPNDKLTRQAQSELTVLLRNQPR